MEAMSVKDPRINMYVSAPFACVSWNEYDEWHIESRGCGCCSSTKDNVSLQDLISLRDQVKETVKELDDIIRVKKKEDKLKEKLAKKG